MTPDDEFAARFIRELGRAKKTPGKAAPVKLRVEVHVDGSTRAWMGKWDEPGGATVARYDNMAALAADLDPLIRFHLMDEVFNEGVT